MTEETLISNPHVPDQNEDNWKHDFHLEEYKSLKSEISNRLEEARRLEVLALSGTALVYAWLSTNTTNNPGLPLKFAWAIPLMFTLLGSFRAYALFYRVLLIARYLRKLERRVAVNGKDSVDRENEDQLPGWERYLHDGRSKREIRTVGISAYIFWSALAPLTLGGALLPWYYFPDTESPAYSLYSATYHSCESPHTCTFSLPGIYPLFGKQVPVRFAGAITPPPNLQCEKGRKKYQEALTIVQQLLEKANQIDLVKVKRDQQLGLVAKVIADGEDVAKTLVSRRLAIYESDNLKNVDWCHTTVY